MRRKNNNNIKNIGDAVIDKGISEFETGTAPYPNYTNLTFFPTREETRFYQAGRDGETEIEAFRLKNEELYKKDPLYQLRLNLMAPETNAIKAFSNKSTREMLEEITKAKYKKLLEEKKYFENIPERFHPLIRRVLEQSKISPKEGNAVAVELDNAVRMGQVSDVMARQIRRMIETQTELQTQFNEDDERRIISDLSTARERIIQNLRRDARFNGKSEGYLGAIADNGLKDALDVFNASNLTRDLGNLTRAGFQASINRHIINTENLFRDVNNPEVVEQDADNVILGGAVENPRTRNGPGEGFDLERRGRGVRDIWAEQDENTYGLPLPDGYNIRPGPSFDAPDEVDEYTGTRRPREILDFRQELGRLGRDIFREEGDLIEIENPIINYIQTLEDARDSLPTRVPGGAMTPGEFERVRRERRDFTPEELQFRESLRGGEGRGRGRGGRGRGGRGGRRRGAISTTETATAQEEERQRTEAENFFRRQGFLR